MKCFTLVEIAFVLLLMSLVVVVGFSFLSFNSNFFYLRDISKKFAFAIDTASDMAQKLIEKNSNFYCAYGIYFSSSSSYEVIALSTSTYICEYIFASTTLSNNFINSNISSKQYVLQNQQISSTSPASLSLNISLKPNSHFKFSTSSKNCASNLINPPIIFLYVYGYNDLFFMYQISNNNWSRIISDKIYICLETNNPGRGSTVRERYTIKVSNLGQLSFER